MWLGARSVGIHRALPELRRLVRLDGFGEYTPTDMQRINANSNISDSKSSMGHDSENQQLSIFLCHSSGDKTPVRSLYCRLTAEGFAPWLDEENLLPGQNWRDEILKAIRASDVIMLCL